MARESVAQSLSRRRYLATVGGTAVAASAGLAGCTGGGGGSADELKVAYMPIYPDMQYFVMEQEGYFDDLDVTVDGQQFPDGPSIVQAFASENFDVAMFGVVPSLVIIDKGIPAKIAAANIKDAIGIVTSDEFAGMWEAHGKDAFEVFRKEKGRKFKFGTFPPGSVPDILLRYWMTEELGLSVEETVDVVPMGASQVRQALLAGEIDGTSIMEPIPTIASENDAGYSILQTAAEFFPGGQPAAVVLMADRIREDNPEIGKAFLKQHRKATQFANDSANAAAQHASSVIGSNTLPVGTAKKAMQSPLANFTSNPHDIEDGATIYSRFANDLGKLDKELTKSEIFDFSLYEEVTG